MSQEQTMDEECDCTCHGDPDGEVEAHAMPCCMRCTHCGKAIEVAFWATHSAECGCERRTTA
ncbi:MAG TPA: hypothetical protein VL426_01425 [Candidatus Binatia bacterium]|jgi:hypothetical protein|nr:hypothetical protein [Candidatus Binatia bacterium]